MPNSRKRVLVAVLLTFALLSGREVLAGTYGKINQSDWQQAVTGLPTYVNMYSFVPSAVASKPPIVVYLHHCQGNAASSHSSMAALETLADKNGFLIIYPEATGENCWDAGSKRSLKNGGGGDTGAIVQMVKYYVSKYSGDADRVYVAGDSSGGIMTEAILGVYPDVFMAGVSIMGVPCGCWGQSDYNDVTGTGGSAQWCGSCAGGTVSKTGAQWGDLVKSYFPGYTGHRPRLQHWHGATDTTLNFKNVAEDIKEWTNLLGLSETPTTTEQNTPKSGTTHQAWKNSCYTVYETFVLANTGHMVSVDGNTLAKYFGIDTVGGQDPETVACGASAVPGGGGGTTPGAGGSGGTGTGGAAGNGGGRDAGTVGRDAAGDVSAPGGTTGSGGTGTASGTGGMASVTGGSGAGGSGKGGTPGSGGVNGIGGQADGSGGSGQGGAPSGTGGANGTGGSSGTGGSTTTGGDTGGCSCSLGSRRGLSTADFAALLFVALVLVSRRRR
jgi:acetylxylan esterase